MNSKQLHTQALEARIGQSVKLLTCGDPNLKRTPSAVLGNTYKLLEVNRHSATSATVVLEGIDPHKLCIWAKDVSLT